MNEIASRPMKITPHRLSFGFLSPGLLSLGLLSLGLLLGATALASAKPAYVPSTVNLRAAPGTTSEILAKIPGGSLVDTGECSEGWCEITWQDKKGFAIQSALDMSGRVPPQRAARPPAYRGRGYSDEPAYVEGPPEGCYE